MKTYLARAAWLQWRLLRAGDYAGVIELSSRAIKLRRLAEEIAADRAWIAARLERTFTARRMSKTWCAKCAAGSSR